MSEVVQYGLVKTGPSASTREAHTAPVYFQKRNPVAERVFGARPTILQKL